MVETFTKEPIMKCSHKMEQKCHKTHVTYFTPSQEKVCEEYFEKKCKIVFIKKKVGESIRKCIRPLQKICDGSGPQECRTVYETSCSTKVKPEYLSKLKLELSTLFVWFLLFYFQLWKGRAPGSVVHSLIGSILQSFQIPVRKSEILVEIKFSRRGSGREKINWFFPISVWPRPQHPVWEDSAGRVRPWLRDTGKCQ